MKIIYDGKVPMHAKHKVFINGEYDVPLEDAEYLLKTFPAIFIAKEEPKPKASTKTKAPAKPKESRDQKAPATPKE